MNRIVLILLFVVFGYFSQGQNLRGNNVEAMRNLKTYETLEIDTSYSTDGNESFGQSFWDENNRTMSTVLNNGVVGQWFKELFIDGQNNTGSIIANGTPVMYAGSIGNSGNFKITPAYASASIPSFMFVGLVTHDVAIDSVGKITTTGKLRGIQTNGANYGETWADGDLIYLGTSAGTLTKTAPNAPLPAIPVALVISAHATSGTLEVRPTFPQSLTELTDVNGTPLTQTGQFPVWNNDEGYFDFDVSIDNYVNDSIFDNITGAFRLYGGRITDNGDGTVSIGSGAGIIKDTEAGPEDVPMSINDGQGGSLHYVSWDSVSSLSLSDDAYNYIYLDGTDSTIKSTTNFYSISFTQDFTLGRAYKDGTDIVARLCGTNAWNFNRRVQLFGEEVFPVIRGGNGLIIAEAGTLQFTITEGILWAELVNRFTVGAYDGTTTNFNYWYRDGAGGWTKTTASAIDNQNYDNNSGTLQALTAQRYGVHWVYEDHAGDVHVIYGQGNYTENEAQTAPIPNPRPGVVSAYSTIIGKIVVQKGQSTFYSIQSAFTDVFDLLNLPDGLTTVSTDSTLLGDGTVTDPLSVDATKFSLGDFDNSMGSDNITDLASAVLGTDAVNKNDLDAAISGVTDSYISNVTESGNNITFSKVGSAFSGSIGSIAKTDIAQTFSASASVSFILQAANTSTSGSGVRVSSDNTILELDSRLSANRFRFMGDGSMYAFSLGSGTKSNVLYIDPSTKEIFEGAAPSGSGTVTSVTAGNGMNFTTITSSGSVTLGTPSTITSSTTNSVTSTSHTHALGSILYDGIAASTNPTLDNDNEVVVITSTSVTKIIMPSSSDNGKRFTFVNRLTSQNVTLRNSSDTSNFTYNVITGGTSSTVSAQSLVTIQKISGLWFEIY